MINTREYSWSDVTIVVGGHVLTGVRGVSYKTSQEKEAIYGKGDEPVSIQRGNKSHDGTLTLLQSEYEALKEAAGGSVLDINVNMVVSYGNPGDVITTDKLVGCEFTEEPKEMQQGNTNQEIALPFIFLRQE